MRHSSSNKKKGIPENQDLVEQRKNQNQIKPDNQTIPKPYNEFLSICPLNSQPDNILYMQPNNNQPNNKPNKRKTIKMIKYKLNISLLTKFKNKYEYNNSKILNMLSKLQHQSTNPEFLFNKALRNNYEKKHIESIINFYNKLLFVHSHNQKTPYDLISIIELIEQEGIDNACTILEYVINRFERMNIFVEPKSVANVNVKLQQMYDLTPTKNIIHIKYMEEMIQKIDDKLNETGEPGFNQINSNSISFIFNSIASSTYNDMNQIIDNIFHHGLYANEPCQEYD